MSRAADWASDRAFRGVLGLALRLPYARRVRMMGWAAQRLLSPMAGYDRRSRENLALIWPDMPGEERERIVRGVADNMGRMLAENYSTADMLAHAARITPTGPGVEALRAAREAGRPVILLTGHFGNFGMARAAIVAQGYSVGALYRPMRNAFFSTHYVGMMEAVGGPAFPQGRRGTASFVRHLKEGGQMVLLFDQHVSAGAPLDFLGRPAKTALSAAELALKYGALLIPFYATRQPDGLDFAVDLEAPVPHTDARDMMQKVSDSLAARVRAHPEQWFWVHRRWK